MALLWLQRAKRASTVNDSPDTRRERQLDFLRALLVANASIGGDVLEIGKDTWAIHGVIPVDGEVLMAEFGTYDEANEVLDQLRGGTDPDSGLLDFGEVATLA
jgi:hypothetical protein